MDDRLQRLRRFGKVEPAPQALVLQERIRRGELSKLRCAHQEHLNDRGYPGSYTSTRGFRPPCCQGTNYRPFLRAIELAAFCGHEASRLVCTTIGSDEAYVLQGDDEPWDRKTSSDCPECGWFLCHQYDCKKITFKAWVMNLERWGTGVMTRAGVVAADIAIKNIRNLWRGSGYLLRGSHAVSLEAAEVVVENARSWIEDPSTERLNVWRRSCGLDELGQRRGDAPAYYVPQPLDEGQLAVGICAAARVPAANASSRRIQEQISATLIEWALA